MKIFRDFFAILRFFYSFFRKNDEKLACFFGVRAYLIDFGFRLCTCGTMTRQAGDYVLTVLIFWATVQVED